jgi:hypothetical protein
MIYQQPARSAASFWTVDNIRFVTKSDFGESGSQSVPYGSSSVRQIGAIGTDNECFQADFGARELHFVTGVGTSMVRAILRGIV